MKRWLDTETLSTASLSIPSMSTPTVSDLRSLPRLAAMAHSAALIVLALLLVPASSALAEEADWNQFRGPDRNGVGTATGLAEGWPEEGPKECWRAEIGSGYAGTLVAGDRIYSAFGSGEQDFVAAFDLEGKEIWRAPIGGKFENQFGDGPRSTPVVAGESLYALGSKGDLVALKTADGSQIWHLSLTERFGTADPRFGYSTSPLVDGDRLILETGGGEGKAFAALDTKTGETLWTAVDGAAGYSSPIVAEIGGVRQYIFVPSADAKILALTAGGEVLWSHDWEGGTIAMPIVVDGDKIFASASSDVGAVMLKIKKGEDGTLTAEEVWRNREMKNHFSSSVIVDGYVYGFDGATLKCLDATTGERKWVKRGLGKGSLVAADGKLFIFSDRGKVVMAEATPETYQETGSLQLFEGKTWTSPTVSGGRLYLRDHEHLVCLNVAA